MGHDRSSDSQADITRPTNADIHGRRVDHDDLSVSTAQRTLTARFPPAFLASAPRLPASEGGSWRHSVNTAAKACIATGAANGRTVSLDAPRPRPPVHSIDTAPLSPPSLAALNFPWHGTSRSVSRPRELQS